MPKVRKGSRKTTQLMLGSGWHAKTLWKCICLRHNTAKRDTLKHTSHPNRNGSMPGFRFYIYPKLSTTVTTVTTHICVEHYSLWNCLPFINNCLFKSICVNKLLLNKKKMPIRIICLQHCMDRSTAGVVTDYQKSLRDSFTQQGLQIKQWKDNDKGVHH